MRDLTETQVILVSGGNGAYYAVQGAYQDFANSVQAGADAVSYGAGYVGGFVSGFFQGFWNAA